MTTDLPSLPAPPPPSGPLWPPAPAADFPPVQAATVLPDGGVRLEHLGVLRIQGEDATKFIHAQLTHDFALLPPDQARLAALCSPKGRMLASFIGYKTPDGDVLLLCNRDLLAAMLQRLSMFVLRAKARLSDASADFTLWGLAGSATKSIAAHAVPAWSKAQFDAQTVIQLYPADSVARQLLIAPAHDAPPSPPPAGPMLDSALWHWGEVRSGVAMVGAAVSDALVPQMLNYESVGGVSFKKGCYPGQEVVARSQFRGTLKRRATLAHCAGPLHAGQEITSHSTGPEHADGVSEPAGLVVQAAPHPAGGWDAIVCLQRAAMAAALEVASQPLHLLALPYPLLEDV